MKRDAAAGGAPPEALLAALRTARAARAVRRGAGLFAMEDRGLLSVRGGDRVRWLDGMVTNDVGALSADPERSGCYAALLTPQGRIVADLHILHRGDAFWLETARAATAAVLARLERYLVADDVELADCTGQRVQLGLEGPRARAILEAACGRALRAGPDCVEDIEIDGRPVAAAAFGWSGEPAWQLFVVPADAQRVRAALRLAGESHGLVEAGPEVLEVLRIEAGTPAWGSELAEDTLPDEAGIGRAICTTKGCYTGQEVVARLRARSGVKHRMVGLVAADDLARPLPEPGTRLLRAADARRTGELTSRCLSLREELLPDAVPEAPAEADAQALLRPIGLGFVHRDDAAPGTPLEADGRRLLVEALPLVRPAGEA